MRVPDAGSTRFYWLLRHGTPDGGTRLCRIKAKERTALTALFYGGTVATNCREMTIYDADERFWMLIRPTSRVFYDVNSAFNSYFVSVGARARRNWVRLYLRTREFWSSISVSFSILSFQECDG